MVGTAIGGFCLWLALRSVELSDVSRALGEFDLRYLLPAVALSLGIQLLRALRWKLELSPLARLPFSLTWLVVAVAYMMINVLPFRLGEPVRPLLMSWKSGLSVSAVVGNWVFEKMMDSAVLVLFIHVTLLATDLPHWAWKASVFSLGIFSALFILVVGFWLRGQAFFDSTLGRFLPEGARNATLGVLKNAREGLSILPDRRLVALVFAVTTLLWFLPIVSSYVLILGFGFPLPFSAALVVFVAIGVGTALPNPPGMIGVFQYACVVALGIYGIPEAQAVAYGIVLNAIQLLTLIAQGAIALPILGVDLGGLTRTAVHEPAHPC